MTNEVKFRKVVDGWLRIYWLAGAAGIRFEELRSMSALDFGARLALAADRRVRS